MSKNIIASLLGIFLAVLLSEIILQILNIPPRPVSGWTNCRIKNPGECNYLGFRGREIYYTSDDFVVLLVGDSEVYAPHLPFNKMPERRLEHFLKKYNKNVKVFTIADMGYGQAQQYLALKKYFSSHRADLILLMFTSRDDLVNNIFPITGGKDSIKPTFFIKNGELRGPSEGWLESVDGYWFKLDLLAKYFIGESPGKLRHKIWETNILPKPYIPLKSYNGDVDYSWQEEWKAFPLTAYKGIEFQKTGPVNKMTPRSERWTYGIRLTRELLSSIKKLVERNGAHFILFKEERPWESKDEEKVHYLNGGYYKTSMKQYRENLKDIFEGFKYYLIPLDRRGHRTNPNDEHLTVEMLDELFRNLSRDISQGKYLTSK
jgi:hypothetical protein